MTLRIFPCLLLFLTSLLRVAATSLPVGGVELVTTQDKISGSGGQGGSFAKVAVAGQAFPEASRVTVVTPDPNQPWCAQLMTPLTAGSVKSGDKLLVVYMARCVAGGVGRAIAKVQLSDASNTLVGMTGAAKLGAEWSQVNQAFVAEAAAPEGKGEVVIFLGEQSQTVEISGLRVLNYGPTMDLAKLPQQKETYVGREPEAAWRKAALERIEKIRRADMVLQLTDAAGKPRANTSVVVELDRHHFGFGSCVTRDLLTREGPDGDRYRAIAERTFSRVIFENDLKPDSFPHDDAGREQLRKSLAWLKARGISVRGHYLMQEAVDGWSRERLGDPVKFKAELLASVRERIAFLGDQVVEWDVINHPIAWQNAETFAQKAPPLNTLSDDVFREARRLTTLPLCINEDQLFRPGPQQDKTFALLEKLKRDGVRVDGLGNQSHFHCSFLPSPEEQLRITDRFAAVVPRQIVTEFDIVTNGDESLAADYLRDSLIVCFSHPAYDGFILWGYWQGSHWIPEAALWNKDWSPKASARTWQEWVGKRWHTRLTLTSDAAGRVKWRGFRGTYRLALGDAKTAPFLPGSAAAPQRVSVP